MGLFGFGGGPSMIPLMKAECVDVRGWMSDDQFLDALAMGSSLPGPISVKMALYVGLRVAGPVGALVAFLAVCAPSGLLMLTLAGFYLRFRGSRSVAGAMWAVRPVVVALLVWTLIGLAPDGVRSWAAGGIAVAALAALLLRVHPALVIVAALVMGAVFHR